MTYLNLKHKNLNVSISRQLVPGKICVAVAINLRIRQCLVDSFLVGCRCDHARPTMCEMTIVQNQAHVESETDILLPHWPQPGLLPRLKERGNRIENMVFKGRSWNLYHEFRSPEFQAALADLGVRLIVDDETGDRVPNWYDYSAADLVLAVRDLTEQDALTKPASKLVNAWIAGAPAILGPEPAFQELRKSELDYMEVRSPSEALDAIHRLKSRPELYEQMIANGLKRAEDYSRDRMVQRWVDVLSGPVAERYRRWLKEGRVGRLARFPVRAVRQKLAYRSALYHRDHGYHIVSGRVT